MKRLISILVVFAMMLALVATSIPAFATEGEGGGEAAATPLATYKVNWKELVDGGTMKAQWVYDRSAAQNNFASKYNIFATETDLTLTENGGENRSYYSQVMFAITNETNYVYELEVNTAGYKDGGVVFAWAEDANAYTQPNGSRGPVMGEGDTNNNPKAPYFIQGAISKGEDVKVHFGGPYQASGEDYTVFDTGSKTNMDGIKVSEDGYVKLKIVYTGLTVEMFYLNENNEYVEFFADKTMTLVEGSKVAFGITTWNPDWANIRNCTLYAMNEAAKSYVTVDKTAFADEIAKAKALKEIDYTPDSWAAFYPAIATAEAAYKTASVQTLVDAALANLQAALTTLVKSPDSDKTALNAAITAAKALDPADYKAYFQTKLTAAIAAAEAIYAGETINENEENAAIAALTAAVDSLVAADVEDVYYNVNWKKLYDDKTMRAQWLYERQPGQNNFENFYKVNATETSISFDKINGDTRLYYSEIMPDLSADTYYEYVFEVSMTNVENLGGVMFAFAENPDGTVDGDTIKDTEGVVGRIPVSGYYLKGGLSSGSAVSVHFGGHYSGYDVGGAVNASLADIKRSEDGYATYKVIFDGLLAKFYYLKDNGDDTAEFVEFFADKTVALAEASRIAFGVYNKNTDYPALRNCVLTAGNEAAQVALERVYLDYHIMLAGRFEKKTGYTTDTFAALTDALAAARAANDPATYDALSEALDTARLGLKKAASKTALKSAIDAAKAKIGENTADDFTAATWAKLDAALTAAETAYANGNLTNSAEDQKIVDDATAALKAATERLTEAGKANLVDFNAAIKAYEALVETDYTPDSWAAAMANKAAYYEAKILETKELTEADQGDIDAATEALNAILNALVKRADFSKLQSLVNRVNALDKNLYKEATWAIDDPLAAAETILANFNATQADVDAALEALKAAYDALETVRTNVLLITVPENYDINDKVSYPPESATEYNKITDMSYHGLGNVFYYDYHKVIANAGFSAGWVPGTAFEKSLGAGNDAKPGLGWQGKSSYVLRLGTVNGSATNRAVDGIKVKDSSNFSHQATSIVINGKDYSHAFGYSFRVAPTFDSVAFYLPTDTNIASIDVYGANREFDEAGNVLFYGKADSSMTDETGLVADKVYLGTVTVPAAEAGAENILAQADLMAFEAEYVYFAINYKEGTSATAYYTIYEVELYGFNAEDENLKADFSELNALFALLDDFNEADYTPLSWKTLVDTVNDHGETIMSALSTQEAVDAAVDAIEAAIDGLAYEKADFTALDEMLAVAELFVGSDDSFTPGSFAALTEAIAFAKELKELGEVPQSWVDAATEALFVAISGLDEVADKSALAEIVAKADTYKEAEWQGNGIAWSMFADALNDAKAILENVDAVQDEIDAIIKSLESKIAELKPTPGVTPGQPGDNDQPADDNDKPADDTDKPADDTDKPADDTDKPADDTDKPADDTDKPADDTDKPGESETDPVEPEDTDPVEPEDTDPVESETEPVESETETATSTTAAATDAADEGGCGSSIALSALAVVGVIGTAVVLKKKED